MRAAPWGVTCLLSPAACLAPAQADAAVVGVASNSVEFRAAPGERNAVSLRPSDARGTFVTVRDPAGITPGNRCLRPDPRDPSIAVCAPGLAAGSVASLDAALGDGDDSLVLYGDLGLQASGGAGADRMTGGPGDDELRGDSGRDTLRGAAGDDRLLAGSGGGAVLGGGGDDDLEGGPGSDSLDGGRGTDELSGVGGADVLRARDRTPDAVFCGRGRDRAAVDDADFISSACERRTRGRSGAATVIDARYRFFSPSFSEGGTNLMIGCPGDRPRACTGTVIVQRRGKVLGRGPFRVARDRVGQARDVRPTRAGAALPTGRPVRATIVLVTSDRQGRRVVRRRAGSAEDFDASEFE